jgi:hypothetical protein
VLAAPPTPVERLGDLIVNVRAFDGLARHVWGGDAALTTLQMDEALAKAEKARIAFKKHHKAVLLQKPFGAVFTTGNVMVRELDPGDSALAKSAISSLKTNLALLRKTLRTLTAKR